MLIESPSQTPSGILSGGAGCSLFQGTSTRIGVDPIRKIEVVITKGPTANSDLTTELVVLTQ